MSKKSKVDALEKAKIVKQYLNEEIIQKDAAKVYGVNRRDETCARFGIWQRVQLMNWIKVYNEGKELKNLPEIAP